MTQPPGDREGQLVMARSHLDQLLEAISRRGLPGPSVCPAGAALNDSRRS